MDNTLSCQNMAPLAKETTGATGGLVEGVPLICGGGHWSVGKYDECYIISMTMTSLVTNMKSKRQYAASVVLNSNKLWVMGGLDIDLLNTTEYIQTDTGSISGPELPIATKWHATVAWNSSSVMLIGGYNVAAKTFHYNLDKPDEGWILGPELDYSRHYHAAALGRDRITNDTYIAVTGGYWDGNNVNLVELLYEGETEWQSGNHQ